MKEKILAKIKLLLGKTGLSERTLAAKAERLAKKITSDDLLTDEVIQDVVEDLKELEGQMNHEIAEKIKAAVPAPPVPPTPPTPPTPSTPPTPPTSEAPWVKEILDFKKKLESEASEKQTLEKRNALMKGVDEGLKKAGAEIDLYREHVMLKHGVDDKKTVDENVKELQSHYDSLVKEQSNTDRPWSGGGKLTPVTQEARKAAIKADLDKEKDKWKV